MGSGKKWMAYGEADRQEGGKQDILEKQLLTSALCISPQGEKGAAGFPGVPGLLGQKVGMSEFGMPAP